MKPYQAIIGLFVLIYLGTACTKEFPEPFKQIGIEREDQQERIDLSKKDLNFENLSGFKGVPGDYTFSVVATITPPVVNGLPVQACYVHTDGSKIYVTYNTAGDQYGGAIDIYNYTLDPVNTQLTSFAAAEFPTSDINCITTIPHAGDSYEVFIVGATIGYSSEGLTSPACLMYFDNNLDNIQVHDLQGYAGNSINYETGSANFSATSGSNGGLYVIDRATLGSIAFLDKANLTSVYNYGDIAYQVCSEPARLDLYNLATANAEQIILPGCESNPILKSSVEVANDYSFLALNEGGIAVIRNADNVIVASLSPTNSGGIDPEYLVSNGLCIGGYRLYSANGGGGLTVFELDVNMQATPMGNVVINSSVNHVSIIETDGSNGYLSVATGTGGVQIIRFTYTGAELESFRTGTSGGTYQLFNNRMIVDVPTGALGGDQTITVTIDRDYTIPGVPVENTIAFEFTPDGLIFTSPITVKWYGDFSPAVSYTLALYDSATGTHTTVPVTVAADGSHVIFSTDHFSTFVLHPEPILLTDTRDGNEYNTVIIGTQIWMAENLAYLPEVSPSNIGSNTEKHYYTYGYNGTDVSSAKSTANYDKYGALYNWEAAKAACPNGWHLPTDDEWTVLSDYLTDNGFGYEDSGNDIGKSMASISDWSSSSFSGDVGNDQSSNNHSAFNALPGGDRHYSGGFYALGNSAYFWSSTEGSSTLAWFRILTFGNDKLRQNNYHRSRGFSVRCIGD
ncbi:MAG: fibrobacter succinogenes major paralogous domain-containing protein [Bacteroidales bacterium]|nr:fibrobacter succinogenes major paralogous domain-containing protein [Bacteroidales bacterium]